MTPLYSNHIESLYPVYSLSCADVILEYTNKKAEHGSPDDSAAERSKLMECIERSAEKIKDTPCDVIRKTYADCIRLGGRVNCRSIKAQLEDCGVKHVGKLD